MIRAMVENHLTTLDIVIFTALPRASVEMAQNIRVMIWSVELIAAHVTLITTVQCLWSFYVLWLILYNRDYLNVRNFNLTEVWSGSQTNVWGDDQCSLMKTINSKTLIQCKQECLRLSGCTAVQARNNEECKLKGCTQPVPTPNSLETGWSGHYLLNGNKKL